MLILRAVQHLQITGLHVRHILLIFFYLSIAPSVFERMLAETVQAIYLLLVLFYYLSFLPMNCCCGLPGIALSSSLT